MWWYSRSKKKKEYVHKHEFKSEYYRYVFDDVEKRILHSMPFTVCLN